ncbi:Tetratricopeptide repeat-containing protein [Flavobacteriaceae bacterium MAR_2010_188]|nr:Tetratricopeptide repeat-containing protein [Flavobacteriaceae bacterium MAR_2010_188]
MKKQFVVALALLVGSMSFAQKDELKTAEKAIKNGNYADAKSAIMTAESKIGSADEKMQAEFYFLKGQALYANGNGANEDMIAAIESFDKAVEIEKASGKDKYTGDINEMKTQMMSSFLTSANTALENKEYMKSSAGFEQAYRMSPKDTIYLYYAASTAVTAQDYDTSLAMYEKLRDLGYNGETIQYVATNKETGEEENFPSPSMRDISVKAGSHIAPKQTKSESKSAEIIKNIALIYVTKGEDEKAIEAMRAAREANPDDLSLVLTEANVQLKMGNKDEFRKLIEVATEKDPNNAELQYNLGVVAAESGDLVTAETYYKKAIELDPNYADAYNNMAVMILSKEKEIVEQMNGLGSSAADDKKFDQLKKDQVVLYTSAIPYLQKSLELKPGNIQAAKTLMNIYSVTEQPEKFKEMKAKVEEMESQK